VRPARRDPGSSRPRPRAGVRQPSHKAFLVVNHARLQQAAHFAGCKFPPCFEVMPCAREKDFPLCMPWEHQNVLGPILPGTIKSFVVKDSISMRLARLSSARTNTCQSMEIIQPRKLLLPDQQLPATISLSSYRRNAPARRWVNGQQIPGRVTPPTMESNQDIAGKSDGVQQPTAGGLCRRAGYRAGGDA